jgi:hypothetical protein
MIEGGDAGGEWCGGIDDIRYAGDEWLVELSREGFRLGALR